MEITKLADQEGPNTMATRSLGDQNLLLVDEGHRGMSGKEEGVWFTRRSNLCAKGFTFEYSATFEQAVQASGNADFENSYAKTIVFDYSYRWFYEDGFGKDYQILNLPKSFKETQSIYMTACLLKFYQQLRIYEEKARDFDLFNLEDSDFTEAMFASVKDSTSPVNLLIGSKKFVEGWDCWRVSTMGLMHVGRSEGSQIIQLFGRGVRLKGYEWKSSANS